MKKTLTYTVAVQNHQDALRVLRAAKILQEDGALVSFGEPLLRYREG